MSKEVNRKEEELSEKVQINLKDDQRTDKPITTNSASQKTQKHRKHKNTTTQHL